MSRPTAGARSFLRQIAEPIPRAVRPLVSRGTVNSRASAAPFTLDLIRPLFEANEASDESAVTDQHIIPSSTSRRTGQEAARSGTSSPLPTPQRNPSAAPSVQHRGDAAPHAARRDNTSEQAPQSSPREKPHGYEPHRTENGSRFEFTVPQSFAAQALPPQSERPIAQSQVSVPQPENRSGTHVHIGTVEVRIPAPPAPNAQPSVTASKADSRRTHRASGRITEPLARGLAWSHGLVQG